MTTRSHRRLSTRPRLRAAVLLACPLVALPAAGQESRYDKLWSLAEVYSGQPDGIVQSVQLGGRLQLDQAAVYRDEEKFSDTSLRRFRFGAEISFRNDFVLSPGVSRVQSDDANGVRFARYESELVDGRGDDSREMYLGLNYYLYGHKLKVQSGLQYADMDDRARDGGGYNGWAWTTGFRISW